MHRQVRLCVGNLHLTCFLDEVSIGLCEAAHTPAEVAIRRTRASASTSSPAFASVGNMTLCVDNGRLWWHKIASRFRTYSAFPLTVEIALMWTLCHVRRHCSTFNKKQLKVEIAMHCNLRPPDVAPVVSGWFWPNLHCACETNCNFRASDQTSDTVFGFGYTDCLYGADILAIGTAASTPLKPRSKYSMENLRAAF